MIPKDISTPLTSRTALLAASLILAVATPGAMAATGSWALTTTATGDWSAPANWTGSIPSLAGDTANFNLNYGSTNRTVTIDGTSRTVGVMNMGDPSANYWTVTIKNTGGATLTFDNTPNGVPAALSNVATNNTVVDVIEVPVTLTSNLSVGISAKGTDGNSLSMTGVVSGPGSITKSGTGGMQLTNNSNSFAGGFTLNEGNIHLGGSLALGPATFTVNGGTIVPRGAARAVPNAVSVGGNFTAGIANIGNSLTFSGAVDLLAGNRTITVANTTVVNDFTLSGVVSNGGITKDGAGTLVMSGTSTYTGATTVSAGTLILKTAEHPIDTSSGISVNGAGAKLVVGDTFPSLTIATPTVTLSQGTVDGTGTIDSLVVTNSAANIVTAGNGTGNPLQVNALTFQGAATLNIRATEAFSDQYIIAPNLTTAGPATVTVNMTNTNGSWITGSEYMVIDFDTYGTPDATHFSLVTPPGLNPTQTATLINTGGELIMRITGDTLKWTGNESSDWTTVPILGSRNWSFKDAPAEYTNGSAVTFDDFSGFNFDVNLAQNVSPGDVVFENSSNDYTLSSINGFGIQTGTLTKGGTAKLTLSTANAYTGATTINGGTLEISGTGSIASSSTIVNKGQLIFDLTGGTNNYANPIGGAGAFTKSGSGVLTLSGANTFTGTLLLSGGTLNLNSAGALGAGTTALTISGGTLDNSSASDVVLSSARPQTWSGDFDFTGTRSLDMGAGNVTVTGSTVRTVTVNAGTLTVGEIKAQAAGAPGFTKDGAGTLVFTSTGAGAASSVVNGLLTVNNGTVQINRTSGSDANTVGDLTVNGLAGTGRITNGAAFERWLYVNATMASTFSGSLENGGTAPLGLIKQGAESLTLDGTSSHTGPTRIIAGNLIVKNGNALGASLVSVREQAGGMVLEGGITVPNDFLLSNDGTAVGAIGYAILSSSGNNVLTGTLSLMDGSGNTLIKSATGSSLVIGNVTNGMPTLGRILILGGESVGANSVSGIISNGTASATGVSKTGTGTWTLSGDNTYTGSTTVTQGTLTITQPTLSDTSALVIGTTGAVLNLTHSSTDQVGSLTINGVLKGNGVYDATTDPGFITGTGKIRVGSGEGYASWAAGFPFTAGVNDGPEQDADGDGINNVLEYVLGGIPVGAGSHDNSILPAQSLTETDLVLTFRRSDASEGDAVVKVQWSANLGSWNDFATIGATTSLPGVTVTEDSPTAALDTVVVRIPRSNASGQKLFGRVVATKP